MVRMIYEIAKELFAFYASWLMAMLCVGVLIMDIQQYLIKRGKK